MRVVDYNEFFICTKTAAFRCVVVALAYNTTKRNNTTTQRNAAVFVHMKNSL